MFQSTDGSQLLFHKEDANRIPIQISKIVIRQIQYESICPGLKLKQVFYPKEGI